jgi:putative ABC transport system permease protein
MFLNAFLLALREIRRNLMRSFLTTLGIVIGVAAVITMVTLGHGTTHIVADQIASLGSNLLIMRPGQRMGLGGSPRFRLADTEAIVSQISGLKAVAPSVQNGATVVAGGKNWSSSVNGTTNAFFTAGNWEVVAGRLFADDEEKLGRAVCVIGETVRQKLFGAGNPLGSSLRVKNFSCEIIGLLESKGQSAMGIDQDDVVVLPIRTVQRRLTGNQDVSVILISMMDGADAGRVVAQTRALMRERRKLSESDEDDFNILDTKQIAQTLSITIGTITNLLGAVAAVSLLVGGIGIMNIMLVSVTERTREIGIRLAVGALEHEVLLQFLTESVALSAFGGLIGIVLAFGACLVLSTLMGMPFIFDPGINLLAFTFSAIIGVLFGYMPARRAARLDPIEALRRE